MEINQIQASENISFHCIEFQFLGFSNKWKRFKILKGFETINFLFLHFLGDQLSLIEYVMFQQ